NGLTGWTAVIPVGGSIDVVTSYNAIVSGNWDTGYPNGQPGSPVTYSPVDGSQFAVLKTDGPGSFTTLSQTFTANAGDRITGWAFFDAADYMPYNDHAEVVITSSGGGSVTVFSF